ncbi:MAG: thiosulfate oxidation carrier protein SoxY [Cytophagales bacterium]|nr:thiosulfate oxidation carrier protein SoxY [Cytophagales bacterium]
MQRREFISKGQTVMALAAVAGLTPFTSAAQNAAGWNKAAFEGKSLNEVVKALGGTSASASGDVVLSAPEIAENGNVVRMGVESKLAGTSTIALLIEKNPALLSATFDVIAGSDASFSTNVKMGQTSNVYALAKVGDKFFYAVKEVKVTLGGCGG